MEPAGCDWLRWAVHGKEELEFNRLSAYRAAQAMSLARLVVVHEDKISWPTCGPNTDSTIGSAMRSGGGIREKSACKLSRSETVVAGCRCARVGLSRRRSRVRVPSLP
jgi:hypothetical protein